MSHTLTIRPVDPDILLDPNKFATTSNLEILLDGKLLDGVTQLIIPPLNAAINDLIVVTLVMAVNPDFTIPVANAEVFTTQSFREHFPNDPLDTKYGIPLATAPQAVKDRYEADLRRSQSK